MIRANLVAQRVAVESCRQLVERVRDKDPTTRAPFESLLADEEQHAGELGGWLER